MKRQVDKLTAPASETRHGAKYAPDGAPCDPYDPDGWRDTLRGLAATTARLLLALLLGTLLCALVELLCCSCTRTVYRPVETVRTETVLREAVRTVADTVRDTRLVLVKGDTVVDRREVERTRLVELRDTLLIERTDSVAVPVEVERSLTLWERTKMDTWPWLAAALLLLLVWTFRKLLAGIIKKITS